MGRLDLTKNSSRLGTDSGNVKGAVLFRQLGVGVVVGQQRGSRKNGYKG